MKTKVSYTSSMKLFIISLIALLFITVCSAQDKRFTAHATFASEVGVGMGVEYQMTTMYFKAQANSDLTESNIQGTLLGFNIHDRFETMRAFLGGKAGLSFVEGYTYPMLGIESGFEYYFNEIYLGVQLALDHKTDDKYYNPRATGYTAYSIGFKIGFVL